MAGLTGNFGTGKSTVAAYFRKKGARVIDCDRLAHEVFRKGNRLYPKIRSLFQGIPGGLSRRKVARVVFNEVKKRQALETLIHPYVLGRIREEVQRTRKRIVILEVPLLFESGFHRHCDRSLVVKAHAREVVDRLGRKGLGREEIQARWRAQMPLGEKIRRADEVIDNSRGWARTRYQVDEIWKRLKKLERSLTRYGQRKK